MNDEKARDVLQGLTPDEKSLVLKILNDVTVSGNSSELSELYYRDYTEIPVDIDTFLDDPEYAGWYTNNGKDIYPFWRQKLREIFADDANYSEIAITGCLTGDTLIPLLNGKLVSMKDLSCTDHLDEYVYSYDVELNQYVPGHLIDAFSTGIKPVYKITLDNGESFKATSNHKFMTRDKHWKSIDSGLSVGDSLMPLYRGSTQCGRGVYETIKHPQKNGTYLEEPTHRMVMRWKLGRYKGVVHHKNYDKFNNDPRNLLKTNWTAHRHYHAKKGGLAFQEYNRRYKNNLLSEEEYARKSENCRKGSISRWSNTDEHTKMSVLTTTRMKNGFSKYMSDIRWSDPKQHELVAAQFAASNKDPEANARRQIMKAVRVANIALSEYGELTETTYQKVKLEHNMRIGYPSYSSIMKRVTPEELYNLAINYNHRITSIEYVGSEEVFDLTVDKYHNFAINAGIVAHNSIGTGKSHVTIMALAYCLYRLMCLRDPHEYYGIAKGGYIYIVFFNATLSLSQGVAYTKFQSLLQHSPWFLERGKVSGTKYLEYIPNGPIRFTVGSTMEHSIGKDILYGIMDEVNFVKGASIHLEQSKIMKTYSSVLERINSRFIVRGRTMGKLFLVSSKKSEHDFIESYIEKQKGNPGVFIIDAKLWDVKPSGTYSGKMFSVAVGGSNMPSTIIKDDEDIEVYKKRGYKILEVPIEFKSRFEMDIQVALMNIAGISISNVTKFITYENLSKCFVSDKNPWVSAIITLGMKDPEPLRDFFKPELVEPDLTTKPLFIHIDTSLTGDRTGIGCVAAMGMKYQNRYDIATNEYIPTKEMVYRHVFSVGIQCPSGDEISFQKTRDFLYYLKFVLGWNVKGVSLDGYQSADSKQLLITMGFDAVILSLDRTPDGYLTTKSAINERRVGILNIPEMSDEIINLERDNRSGKIDHPLDGSKDISDGFAGALANATNHQKDLDLYLIEDAEVIMSTNPDSVDRTDDILQGLVPESMNIEELKSLGPDILDTFSQSDTPTTPSRVNSSSYSDYDNPEYEDDYDDIIIL